MDTDLTPLIHTNDPPTEAQAHAVRRLLTVVGTQVSQIMSQMSLAQASSPRQSELELRKNQLHRAAVALRMMLSQVRLLPVEILANIFQFCCDSRGVGHFTTDVCEAPMLLCHICSRWRAVAHSTSSLWTVVNLHTKYGSTQDIFQRSGNLPLSLSVITPHKPYVRPQPVTDTNQSCLDLLLNINHRLRQLKLYVSGPDAEPLRQNDTPLHLPVLCSVAIVAQRTPEVPLLVRILDLFEHAHAPHLRILKLKLHAAAGDLYATRLPWAQLTSLHVDMPVLVHTAAYAILAHCTDLESCRWERLINLNSAAPLPRLALRRLRVLALTGTHSEPLLALLSALDVPALRALSLTRRPPARYFDTAEPALPPVLAALQRRSRCELERLSFTGLPLDPVALAAFLKPTPSLYALSLECGADMPLSPALCALFGPAGAPLLTLPGLHTLILGGSTTGPFDHTLQLSTALVRMVETLARGAANSESPFPAMRFLELRLRGQHFPADVEARLRQVTPTGFFVMDGRGQQE
ncbi:hypothetical protein GGX14DRAFT_544358 [Mycena pura]|uniref:F-box domain-containing protein n=1 Tax=Mycena pura TaxID=153505 RepID=A0AAD6V5K9_9AGAR|nr:hypothetical protein GGX14DRAFT_544358 [Mycena pura]